MRDEELHLIYKMIGAYGFSTVKELLDKYEETQAEKQELIEYLKEKKKLNINGISSIKIN